MTDNIDWNQLQTYRRNLAGEPNEESYRQIVDLWHQRLGPDSSYSEEQLDDELVKLLEKIHHAF
jgi:hypothetical protein